MIDELDILLRELQKTIDNKEKIIITEDTQMVKSQIIFNPIDVKYNSDGLYISDKNKSYFWITDPDDFKLSMSKEHCLQFSFRSKSNSRCYGICF